MTNNNGFVQMFREELRTVLREMLQVGSAIKPSRRTTHFSDATLAKMRRSQKARWARVRAGRNSKKG